MHLQDSWQKKCSISVGISQTSSRSPKAVGGRAVSLRHCRRCRNADSGCLTQHRRSSVTQKPLEFSSLRGDRIPFLEVRMESEGRRRARGQETLAIAGRRIILGIVLDISVTPPTSHCDELMLHCMFVYCVRKRCDCQHISHSDFYVSRCPFA